MTSLSRIMRRAVFEHGEVVLGEARDEVAVVVAHRRGDVHELDAALELEPVVLRLGRDEAGRGADEGGKEREGKTEGAHDLPHCLGELHLVRTTINVSNHRVAA